MDNSASEYFWAEYASLQERVDRIRKVGHIAWAIEDQLNDFLESLGENSPSVDDKEREKKQKNFLINRQKKHSHRSRLLQEQAAITPTSLPPESIIKKVIEAELLFKIHSLATKQERRILKCLARGDDYATIAQSEGMSIIALKTKVSRCRQRVRIRLAA